MATMSLLTLLLLSLLCCCSAYKLLLVFPIPTRSHAILGERYVKHLANAGHEITYITPLPMTNPPPRVRQVDISQNKQYMPIEEIFDTRLLINQEVDLQDAVLFIQIFLDFVKQTIEIDAFQNLLRDPNENFDAIIVEWMYTEMFSGLATVFDCPLIWSSSMEVHSMVLSLIDLYPNPAYTFHHLSWNYGFNFWQRVQELWLISEIKFIRWRRQSYENEIYKEIYENLVNMRGRSLPDYEDVRYNGSLVIGNSYLSTSEAISLPQNFKAIGGYHVEEPLPLPKDLQKILDESKHGVIYFSMGSVLRGNRMPDNMKRGILNVFSKLNQTVIWKLEEVLPDLPKNVYILPWAPQTGILAHPNCVLFITHGGLLSKIEAIHFGVPLIGIPLYADQFLNINRAEYKGLGKRVDFYHDGPKKLYLAIREILENSSYRERAKEYSFIHHHRPVPPQRELVHWVEHVIKTQGALHLRSPALRIPWYQRYYVDLVAVILILSVVIFKVFRMIVYKLHLKEKMS